MSPSRSYVTTKQSADSPDRPDRWRDGTHLPHWDGRFIPQTVTFRLAGSVPSHVIEEWKRELKSEGAEQQKKELYVRMQTYLDHHHGRCWLERPEVAKMVQDAILHFDEDRYVLHAWVIMPNHVHVLFSITGDESLSKILHSWRSYTAQKANELLQREGPFWHDDYHDRYIRDDDHYQNAVQYIESNPVKAGLCSSPEKWTWSSAYLKHKGVF